MKLLKTYDEKCIGCNTCMKMCSELYFKEENWEKSCIQVIEGKDGSFALNTCNQCQKCVAECPTLALTVNKLGVVMLNKNLCINCLACVAVCPTNSMKTHKEQSIPFKCIACAACAKECPADALEIVTKEG